MMVVVATQKPRLGLVFRLSTLKGFAALLLFIVSAAIVEYLVVAYAESLGVKDETCFQIPWLGFTISPLFHLVPIVTVIVLAASWTCMVKYIAMKATEKTKLTAKKEKVPKGKRIGLKEGISRILGKIKSGLLKVKSIAYIWDKLSFAKAAVKSATVILLAFLALILLVSALMNPWLVYGTFVKLYQGNQQLLELVKATNIALQGFAERVTPIGWICFAVDNVIKAAAPSIRGFASTLEALAKPLADLPPASKYLVFQNIASWVSALAVLAYGAYMRKSYRYRKVKKV